MRFLGAATLLTALAVPAVLAPPAQALTPQTVFGTVTCTEGQRNSAPAAVWAVTENGSGKPARVDLDNIVGAHQWVKSYSYTGYDAGRFRLVAACTGSAQNPSSPAISAWLKPGRHNLTLRY